MKTNYLGRFISHHVSTVLMIVLFSMVMLSLYGSRAPSASDASASLSNFSSGRALELLKQFAIKPHPVGSPENARVRQFLIEKMKEMGFAATVQDGFGVHVTGYGGAAGYVHNIAVRIKGRVPGKAVMLVAHYDSVAGGPGAADDGAAVAAMLEVLRVLRNAPPQQNDLVFLFTDGEEAGLLGSEAFVADHPWNKDVALVLNFEYRGNSGPFLMFETCNGNGKLVSGLASARSAIGSSLFYEIYRLLPNDTDMSVFKRAGYAGMNFAAVERSSVYHTRLDNAENMDVASLQHSGELMLDMVRYFGSTSLENIRDKNQVFFNVPMVGVVGYEFSYVPIFAIFAILLYVLFVVDLAKFNRLRYARVMAVSLSFTTASVFAAVAVQFIWTLLRKIHPILGALTDPYENVYYVFGICLSIFCGHIISLRYARQRWSQHEIIAGVAFVWLILLSVTSVMLPGASYIFAWPLISSMVAVLAAERAEKRGGEIGKAFLLVLGAMPALLLFPALLRFLFFAATLRMVGAPVLVLMLFLGIVSPVLLLMKFRTIGKSALVLGATLLTTAFYSHGAGKDQPAVDTVFYAKDGNLNQAYWLSDDERLDAWSAPYFGPNPVKTALPTMFGEAKPLWWSSRAPADMLIAPDVNIVGDQVVGGFRNVLLKISSGRNASDFSIFADGATVYASHIDGHAFSNNMTTNWSLSIVGVQGKTVLLGLKLKDVKQFKIRVMDRTYGLNDIWRHPMPQSVIARPSGLANTAVAVTTLYFKKAN